MPRHTSKARAVIQGQALKGRHRGDCFAPSAATLFARLAGSRS